MVVIILKVSCVKVLRICYFANPITDRDANLKTILLLMNSKQPDMDTYAYEAAAKKKCC